MITGEFYIQYRKVGKKSQILFLKRELIILNGSSVFQSLFILQIFHFNVNNRLLMAAIVLGVIVTVAFFAGSPMFGGFDMGK